MINELTEMLYWAYHLQKRKLVYDGEVERRFNSRDHGIVELKTLKEP